MTMMAVALRGVFWSGINVEATRDSRREVNILSR